MSEQNLLPFLPSPPTSPPHVCLSVPWAWFQTDTQHPLALSHRSVWLGALKASQDGDTATGCSRSEEAVRQRGRMGLGRLCSWAASQGARPSSELGEETETPGHNGGQMPGRRCTPLPLGLHKHDCDRVGPEGPWGTLGGADAFPSF